MIKEEFEKFKNHKSVKPWNIDIFNKENWLNGTWKTFSRTFFYSDPIDSEKNIRGLRLIHRSEGEKRSEYEEKCQKVKDNVFNKIKDGFPLNVIEIDDWYKQVITSNHGLSDNTPPFDYMSIGHRQKMVNILIKYFLTYFHTTKDTDIEFCKIFNRNISHIHIPIDNIVLESIYKNDIYRNKFQNRITKKGKQYYLDSKPWSRITDYESYSNFQNTIRNLSKSEGMSPIEFEMKKLWS